MFSLHHRPDKFPSLSTKERTTKPEDHNGIDQIENKASNVSD
jgi:hypothetical protein